MSKIDHRITLTLAAIFLLSSAVIEPKLLGDHNKFLNGFVNHEFINFMGIVVTITLASAANIYIILRKMEQDAGEEFLSGTKRAVRRSAFSLIGALALSIALVVTKGTISSEFETTISIINSIAILLMLIGLSVIYDITRLAFKI